MAHKDATEPPATERTLRNPRRRNRVESDSIKVAPRRKRSKLTETTFAPRDSPDEVEEEDDNTPEHGSIPRSIPRNYRQSSASLASGDVDIPLRGARNNIKRATRVDAARVLTQNENYSVKLLSSTPKELQQKDVEFRGSLLVSANLALGITKEKAYIWDYNGVVGAMSAKSLELPFVVGHHDPIPFGAFVSLSGSQELGLILVSATSGKIIYHESIDRVTSLGFFQERKAGIEGTISGLFTGETVVQLSSADPAGFVALLSSGRIINISLRDGQGKAKVNTQFLYATEQSSGGLFGSIKNILGAGAWKQAVSAITTRQLDRGQVQVLGLLEKGELRVWDLDWSGRYDFQTSIDFREQLQHELRQMRPAERQGDVDCLALLDVAVLDKNHPQSQLELASRTSARPLDAVLLIRCGSDGMHTYALVEFSLTGNDFVIARILDVQLDSQSATQPRPARLIVPAPGHTAFVVVSDAVAIMSLASAALNPDAQLHEASYIEPSPFQDAIRLRTGRNLSFSGGFADASRGASDVSGIMFVNGAGLVRITTHNIHADTEDLEALARSKIEQAVFYGYQDDNILDLLCASRKTPAAEDVEQAALAISSDILHSSPRFFDIPPISISNNLQKRSEAAQHLAAYLQKRYPSLSPQVNWHLLSNAGKIAAGSKLWSVFEQHLNATSKGKRKSTLLNEVCANVRTRHPFESLWPQGTSDDVVRTFFVTQLDRLGTLLPWTRRVLQDVHSEANKNSEDILRLVSEADDIWLTCLNTAFEFRKDNVSQYGIHLRFIQHDTAPNPQDLQDVPELWTSSDEMVKEVVKMSDLSRNAVQRVFEDDPTASPDGYVKKIAKENVALVDMMCQVHLERIAWCKSRGSAKHDVQAHRLIENLDSLRHNEIRQLAEVGQAEASIVLAEKYRDMKTLTEVLIAESQYLAESMESVGQSELTAIQMSLDAIFKRTTRYFDRFGDEFAEAFFDEGFADGHGGQMLSDDHARWQEPMTRYLRKEPNRAKICWINEVVQYQGFEAASKCLYSIAAEQEDNTWNKKVELSLAKLALNAALEDKPFEKQKESLGMDTIFNHELQVVDVQDRLYQHVVPETYHSLDEEAAVQAAMDSFCRQLLAFSTWHQIITQRMSKLLAHQTLSLEELLDLVTLAEPIASSIDDRDGNRSETFEALIALSAASSLKPRQLDTCTKLCWKRAYLLEDWAGINARANSESEDDMKAILTSTNVFRAITSILTAKILTPDTKFIILEPAETLGAGCHFDDLPSYIPEESRASVMEENIIMERQIEALIKEQRIESWVGRIKAIAKEAVDAQSEERESQQQRAVDDAGAANGHLFNGHVNGIKTEELEDGNGLGDIQQAPGHFDHDDDSIELE